MRRSLEFIMVLLALTEHGLQEALKLARDRELSIWCGSDAISETDYLALSGASVSRFNHALASEGPDILSDALATINEHHPDETVWVEHLSLPAG